MIKILLAGHDLNQLHSLRSAAQLRAPHWKIEVCGSAEAAEHLLQSGGFGIVASTLRLPPKGGDALLRLVAERYPSVFRILVCDASEESRAILSTDTVHQFLSEPCGYDDLEKTVRSANSLAFLLRNPQLEARLKRLTKLPGLPAVYLKVNQILSRDDYRQSQLVEALTQDPALVAQILKVANSPFFCRRHKAGNLWEAISILGTAAVKATVLACEAFSSAGRGVSARFNLTTLWDHSLRTGSFAAYIAESEAGLAMERELALTAGVLHDLGKLVLMQNSPEGYQEVLAIEAAEKLPRFAAEKKVFEISHQEAGAYLLGLWGLPRSIVDTVLFHHEPLRSEEPACPQLTFVSAANLIVQKDLNGCRSERVHFQEYLSQIGAEAKFAEWESLFQ